MEMEPKKEWDNTEEAKRERGTKKQIKGYAQVFWLTVNIQQNVKHKSVSMKESSTNHHKFG